MPSWVSRDIIRAVDHELRADLVTVRGAEWPWAGLVRIEWRGPRRVQVERVGQNPADLLQLAGEQQLRDLAVGGGRDGLVDLLPGLFGITQQRRLRHAGVIAGGDGVQVAPFGQHARVGPDLVAGIQRHARAAEAAQRGRPRLQAGRWSALW
jgi:hypothetical protein